MTANPAYNITVRKGQKYFRITNRSFLTHPPDYPKVVNGKGALRSQEGGRYNHGGVVSVYLAEDLDTCVAEKMFYFHREIIRLIDVEHIIGTPPPYKKSFALWEVQFQNDIQNVCDLTIEGARKRYQVYPCMIHSPWQEYNHLKDRRGKLQSHYYEGLRAPSSRVKRSGNMVVLFDDQSQNLMSIQPYEIELRLITMNHQALADHVEDRLHYGAGEARILGTSLPPEMAKYQNWTRVHFNR